MNACIRQRVMSEDELSLVAPFKQRDEKELWQSEFWGKWTLGAVGSYRYNRDPELLAKITRGVQAILATQSPDGYIGNYAPDAQLGGWDVWGRKYTMLGLLAYYDLTGDKKSLEGAVKLADHLLTQIPAQKSIVRAGYYRGMPPSSVLVPMVMLYNRTMDSRYLDFAKYIVSESGDSRRSAVGVESACGCAGGGTFPESRVGTGVVVVGKRSRKPMR